MLKNYDKVLYDITDSGKRFAQITASVVDRQLVIRRVDYNDWDTNPKTGEVEGIDYLDEESTAKLALRLRANTSANFVGLLKVEFGKDGFHFFLSNFREYCEVMHINYIHEAYY